VYERISKREYKSILSQLVKLLVVAPNTLFSRKDILKPVLNASVENTYTESSSNHLRRKGSSVPSGDDIFYHLAGGKLTMPAVLDCVDSLIKGSLIKARRFINPRTPVNIAIDCHDIPFYGKPRGELARWTIGCTCTKGARWCFRLITASVVIKGRRFTTAAIPVSVFDSTPDLLERLIADARKHLTIRHVFLDRGFYSVECIRILLVLGVRFVMPIIKRKAKKADKDILQLMRKCHAEGRSRFTYTLGSRGNSMEIRVVVKKDEDDEDVVGFATNTNIPAKTIGDWYGKRWGIETGYRVTEVFRARTCSRKSAAVRLLLNMLPFALYNAWVLVNVVMRFLLRGGRFLKNNRSDITAYQFCKEIEGFIQSIP
jgi:hypothetical protein